jgi:ABC-type sugar transport system ATPase subunit
MIQLDQLRIRSGQFCLDHISLTIDTGQYAVLMGRTGCGKTTLLEAICGLRTLESGQILVNSLDVTKADPGDRKIGYVPQDLALFPTLTVRQHLEFALTIRRTAKHLVRQRTGQLAEQLSIGHLLDRLPAGLSGGEAQRVALGRALSFEPEVLLLDEPLSALDEETHAELVELLRGLKKSSSVTVLHVTHKRSEAQQLADRVIMFNELANSGLSGQA